MAALMGAQPLGPKEIDGLCVPLGKANTLLADWSDTGQEKWFMSGHTYKPIVA